MLGVSSSVKCERMLEEEHENRNGARFDAGLTLGYGTKSGESTQEGIKVGYSRFSLEAGCGAGTCAELLPCLYFNDSRVTVHEFGKCANITHAVTDKNCRTHTRTVVVLPLTSIST